MVDEQDVIDATWIWIAGLILVGGCSKGEEVIDNPTTAPVEVRSNGAAPTFGEQSGMGMSTGNAADGGQGSGAMGYNGTGAMGTSLAVTDGHSVAKPEKATTLPVLQAP